MSKQVFNHPVPQPGEPTGPSYWRSLDERNKTPEFRTRAEREFVDGAAAITTVERREFLLLMGASFGLAGLGLAGCREPRNHTLPYSKQPENTIPGVATYYASSFPGESANQALIVETHQHRPTKVEGNPSHVEVRPSERPRPLRPRACAGFAGRHGSHALRRGRPRFTP